jgi:hypothetical protein
MSRNAPCGCGSGKKLKHCCGGYREAMTTDSHISDADLMRALQAADDEQLAAGHNPAVRSIFNVPKALEHFGIHAILMGRGTPPIVKRAERLNSQLFCPRDLQVGGLHLGAFLFRDMFCQLYAPVAFGRTAIDLLKLLDLNDTQKAWLASIPEDFARFQDQALDIIDFGNGWMDFGHGRQVDPRGKDLIWRAHAQLEAAAATAIYAFGETGTLQNALLGTELALKAGLAAFGRSDKELQDVGHNLRKAAEQLGAFVPSFDTDRVVRVVSAFPPYVKSRYFGPTPSNIELGSRLNCTRR